MATRYHPRHGTTVPRLRSPCSGARTTFLLREAALARFGGVRVTEVDAAEWQGGELQDLATPSLFGEPRALLITDARSLTKDAIGGAGGLPRRRPIPRRGS